MRYSSRTVASIEQGRRFPSRDFVERAEDVLGGFGAIRGAARHPSRKPEPAKWFRQWVQLEAEAISLCTYECRPVPGLLEAETYARTLFVNRLPPLGDDRVEAQWAARAERQRLLRERPNTAFSFILEERLFLRRTGGPEVTRQLIDHVPEVAEPRNVEVRVMPRIRENHAGLDSPMQLLENPENRWFAHNEGQRGGLFVRDQKELSILRKRYAGCAHRLFHSTAP